LRPIDFKNVIRYNQDIKLVERHIISQNHTIPYGHKSTIMPFCQKICSI